MKLFKTSRDIGLSLITVLTLSTQAFGQTDAQKDLKEIEKESNHSAKNMDTSFSAKADGIKMLEKNAPSNPLKNAYFGETHMHTSYSLDAYIGGNRMTPSDSYRFAKGETMMINGKEHKIERPLDFCAVTDHSEYIGEMFTAMHAQAKGYDQDVLRSYAH